MTGSLRSASRTLLKTPAVRADDADHRETMPTEQVA
jgi:hypothetical protein